MHRDKAIPCVSDRSHRDQAIFRCAFETREARIQQLRARPPSSGGPMKKSTIPDFSRKRPAVGTKPLVAGDKGPMPNPRQPQKPPTKAKNGGRRGT